jgi:hypothetical protein
LRLQSKEARRRLAGIVWRHIPALLLESWRAIVTIVVLIIVFGGWLALIGLRFFAG